MNFLLNRWHSQIEQISEVHNQDKGLLFATVIVEAICIVAAIDHSTF